VLLFKILEISICAASILSSETLILFSVSVSISLLFTPFSSCCSFDAFFSSTVGDNTGSLSSSVSFVSFISCISSLSTISSISSVVSVSITTLVVSKGDGSYSS